MSGRNDFGVIDLARRRIIDGDIEQRIHDFILQLQLFRTEIEFWFSLLAQVAQVVYPDNIYLKKPICIELYEYATYLQWLKNEINLAVRIIRKLYVDKGRDLSIEPVSPDITGLLRVIISELDKPRDKVAAHRYTGSAREFLTINEIISILRQLSDDQLTGIRDQLFGCHTVIRDWLEDPANKNHLVLAK